MFYHRFVKHFPRKILIKLCGVLNKYLSTLAGGNRAAVSESEARMRTEYNVWHMSIILKVFLFTPWTPNNSSLLNPGC